MRLANTRSRASSCAHLDVAIVKIASNLWGHAIPFGYCSPVHFWSQLCHAVTTSLFPGFLVFPGNAALGKPFGSLSGECCSPISAWRDAISSFSCSYSACLRSKKWMVKLHFWLMPLGVRRCMYCNLLGFWEKLPHFTRPFSLSAFKQ